MKSLLESLNEALLLNEGEVASEKDFREYAENKFKEVYGDELDEDKMKKIIDGIAEKCDGDWGKAVGELNKSFGSSKKTNESVELDEALKPLKDGQIYVSGCYNSRTNKWYKWGATNYTLNGKKIEIEKPKGFGDNLTFNLEDGLDENTAYSGSGIVFTLNSEIVNNAANGGEVSADFINKLGLNRVVVRGEYI